MARYPDSWQVICLLGAAVKTGLLRELFSGPRTAEQLAASTKTSERGVPPTLEALVTSGYLERDGAAYRLAEAAMPYADPEHPEYRADALLHSLVLMERWLQLPVVIESGGPVPRHPSPEGRRNFLKTMEQIARDSAPAVADLIFASASGVRRILDVGGGPGAYAKAFLGRGAERVMVQDYPEAIDIVGSDLEAAGVAAFSGDFREVLPEEEFDLAFLGNITHIYGPEINRDLLRRLGSCVRTKGYVAVLDMVRGMSESAEMFAINMLVHTETGGTWTLDEYTGWLEDAGYALHEVLEIGERDSHLLIAQHMG